MVLRLYCLKASAGAGKTHRLTEEFLRLLALSPPSREHLRGLLAITFTNKAAAEMRERILGRLKAMALGVEGGDIHPERARAWLEVILRYWGDFHVRTIDSLVYALLKALALELGVRPQLEVTFREREVLDRCFDALLGKVPHEEGMRRLFQELIDCFLVLERRRGFTIEGQLKGRIGELLHLSQGGVTLGEGVPLEEIKEEACQLASDLLREAGHFKAHERRALEGMEAAIEKDLALWKRDPSSLPEGLRGSFERLKELRDLYLHGKARERLRPYLRLLGVLEGEIDRLMKEEGVLLGGRWVPLVRGYVQKGEASYALFKFGTAFTSFLVDEFQDTDRLQWEVLRPLVAEALSRGGRLFFVGDPKQAIYGWRGGDWRLMGEALEGFPMVSPSERSEERLDCNYRSLERIVDFNNRLFGPLAEEGFALWSAQKLLGEEGWAVEELARLLRENFSDVLQRCIRGPGGAVRVRSFLAPREELLRQVAAALVPEVKEAFGRRPGGVAVLVRSNEQAEEVASWLQAEGVPVVTENALRLRRSQVVKGLVSLLKFLDYPPDDLAFWGVLASGVLHGLDGMEPAELDTFLREGGWSRPLYKAFAVRFPRGFEKYLQPLLRRVGFLGPYEMAVEAMRRLRLFERYPDEAPLLLRFLEVAFRGEGEGVGSLSDFLDFWWEEGVEQRVGLPEGVEAVRVMTVHKAKGLQFPVVFVPFTNWRLPHPTFVRADGGELLYLSRPLPAELEELRLHKRMEDILEALNLLYVATTRAEEELHLYVTCYPRGSGFLSIWLKEAIEQMGLEEQ